MFVALLSLSRSLATKRMSFSNEPWVIRPNLIDLNPVEFNYYPFIISQDKCVGN